MALAAYRLARLRNGAHTVYAAAYDEQMHPGPGPEAEAEAVYVRQLRIRERMQRHPGEFVVWDVGLGAAANVLTLLRLTRDLTCPLRVVSFDDTSEPLEFALAHAAALNYPAGYEAIVRQLLEQGRVQWQDDRHGVRWEFVRGDFPAWCAGAAAGPPRHAAPAPDAIFFDAFSPARNPAMWTLPLFMNLFRALDSGRACSLATYSRSTLLRVTLLRAGFFVGRGVASGLKEETTVAANTPALLEAPLDRRWLERARRSHCAEPMSEPVYRRAPLSPASWEQLSAHPQFHS
jgi:tRNA U34 5-methylaminomethyl-2-thiouridine-forming methyltransferase MnmC